MMWWGIVAEYSKPFHELFEGGSILLFKKKIWSNLEPTLVRMQNMYCTFKYTFFFNTNILYLAKSIVHLSLNIQIPPEIS